MIDPKFYINDGSEKIFTGFASCSDGAITNYGNINNGVWDGKMLAYKKNRLFGVKHYKNGIQEGETIIYDDLSRIIESHLYENGKITYSFYRTFYTKSNDLKIKEYFAKGDSLREIQVTQKTKNDSVFYSVEIIRYIGRKKHGFSDSYQISTNFDTEGLNTLLKIHTFNPKIQAENPNIKLLERKLFENGKYTKLLEFFQEYYTLFSIVKGRKHGICIDYLYDNKAFMQSEYRKGRFVRIIG